MDNGIDFSGTPPGATAIKQAGFDFVCRYLSRYSAKVIKKAEYDDYVANDVGVVIVFEDFQQQALQGFNQGVLDAKVAQGQADALGWPDTRPIYFAVDFDINDTQKTMAGEYMKGVISVLGLGRTGTYGGYYWIKYAVENNLASYFWQAVAWSGGNIHPDANIYQPLGGVTINGTECDKDEARKTDYGQNKGEEPMYNEGDRVNQNNAFFGEDKGYFKEFVDKVTYKEATEKILGSVQYLAETRLNDGDLKNIGNITGWPPEPAIKGWLWKRFWEDYASNKVGSGVGFEPVDETLYRKKV